MQYNLWFGFFMNFWLFFYGPQAIHLSSTGHFLILNPEIAGEPLNIQITETTEGSDYDVKNFETRAKRAGKGGDFITTADGEFIYMKSTVVRGEAQHVFIKDTQRASQGAGAADSAVEGLVG